VLLGVSSAASVFLTRWDPKREPAVPVRAALSTAID
jgi:hypothetical protein